MADLSVSAQEAIVVLAEPRRHAATIAVFERVLVAIEAPVVNDLSIGILWEDLTLWVQGVKVGGA